MNTFTHAHNTTHTWRQHLWCESTRTGHKVGVSWHLNVSLFFFLRVIKLNYKLVSAWHRGRTGDTQQPDLKSRAGPDRSVSMAAFRPRCQVGFVLFFFFCAPRFVQKNAFYAAFDRIGFGMCHWVQRLCVCVCLSKDVSNCTCVPGR